MGALEAKGYKVTIEDGIMKFTHGVMVILQGVRRHNLYYLKGGTTDEAILLRRTMTPPSYGRYDWDMLTISLCKL